MINILLSFHFQDVVMLNGFGTVVNALGKRVKPYLPQICGTILWRLNNKSAKVRQQAADLISRIAVVMKTCQEVSDRNNSGFPRHREQEIGMLIFPDKENGEFTYLIYFLTSNAWTFKIFSLILAFAGL